MHGFLTRDGTARVEVLRLRREALRAYPNVELREASGIDAERVETHFTVTLDEHSHFTARKLLFTTGIVDELPPIDGINALYGKSVFNCPFRDGWEVRDQPLVIYGKDKEAKHLALQFTQWSRDLVFCTDGPAALTEQDLAQLTNLGPEVRTERIVCLEDHEGHLERIVFANGDQVPRRALFLRPSQRPQCDLPTKLGYVFPLSDRCCVPTGTSRPWLPACTWPGMGFAVHGS
jgi:thioredoxin reductase